MVQMARQKRAQKGPGFNTQQRQEKVKHIFSCFQLVALEPMSILLQMIIDNHGSQEEVTLFPLDVGKSLLLISKKMIVEHTSFDC